MAASAILHSSACLQACLFLFDDVGKLQKLWKIRNWNTQFSLGNYDIL